LIQEQEFPGIQLDFDLSIECVKVFSRIHANDLDVIMAMLGKMDETGVGANIDQLPLGQHLLAVNGKIFRRGINFFVQGFPTGKDFFFLVSD
jgi:hypothetical protein